MKRRDFIQQGAALGTMLTVPQVFHKYLSELSAAPSKIDLAIAKGNSPERITQAAINALGGIRRFISRGDIVVIKPNMGWDRKPEYAANTNPDVVAAVVRLCFEAGARKVKVFDYPVNDPRRCYKNSGIADKAKALGAEVSFIDSRKFVDYSIKGESLKSWPLYKDIFDADKLINIPIAKTHSLAKLTLSMKNWMGVMGGNRGRIHWQIDTKLADLALVIKPTLTILDGYRILAYNGPSGGNLDYVRHTKTVAASIDQVAIDSFGATLFGLKGSDLAYVRKAAGRNQGVMDLNRLNIRNLHV